MMSRRFFSISGSLQAVRRPKQQVPSQGRAPTKKETAKLPPDSEQLLRSKMEQIYRDNYSKNIKKNYFLIFAGLGAHTFITLASRPKNTSSTDYDGFLQDNSPLATKSSKIQRIIISAFMSYGCCREILELARCALLLRTRGFSPLRSPYLHGILHLSTVWWSGIIAFRVLTGRFDEELIEKAEEWGI